MLVSQGTSTFYNLHKISYRVEVCKHVLKNNQLQAHE